MPTFLPSKMNRRVVFIVFSSTLLDAAAIGILVPVMQLYFIEEAGFTVMHWGYARGMGGVAKLTGAVVMCMLSDKWGRKYPLVASYAVSSLLYFLTALATRYRLVILIAQCLVGIGGSPRALCMSIMCDITVPESTTRARLISLTAGCFACGMIIGPIIGGVVAVFFSRSNAIAFAAFFQMSAAIVALLCFQETLPQDLKEHGSAGPQSIGSGLLRDKRSSYGSARYDNRSDGGLKNYDDSQQRAQGGINFHQSPSSRIERTVDEHGMIVSTYSQSTRNSGYSNTAESLVNITTSKLRSRGRRYVVFARFMQSFAVQSVTVTYAFFLASTFTDRNVTVSLSQIMAGSGLILSFSEICLYNVAFRVVGPFGTTYLALLLLSTGLILMLPSASISYYGHLLVTCAFYTVGYGMSEAALPVTAAYFADAKNQGTVQGALSAMHSFGKMLSPILYTSLYTYAPTACFYLGGASAFLSVVPLLVSQRAFNSIKTLEATKQKGGLGSVAIVL